jgi:hypothetical protein
MSKSIFTRASFLGAAAAGFVAIAAVAAQPAPAANAPPQPLGPAPRATPLPPPPPGAYGPAPQGAYGPPPAGALAPNPAPTYAQAYLDDYLNYLRNTLRISQAQAPAWERFATTLRANMQSRIADRPVPRDPRAGPRPLPDRLAQRRQRLDAERARLDATEAAIRPLYASLTEEQRRIADIELSPQQLFNGPPRRFTMRDRLRARRPFGRL